jgi:ABC-2 type transport system ATP-binding protein
MAPANNRGSFIVYIAVADTPMITVHGLVKDFRSLGRRLRALDGVELSVARGEVFGLLGANGAGKTTLIKLLLGLSRPTAGSVALRGCDPRDPRARRKIGYLPEGHRFPDYLSGEATLRLFGRLAGVAEEDLVRRSAELLDLVGLADRGRDRVGRYSKGMTQRLGLACALVDGPEMLFLDEPTDGVDPVGRRHIRDVLSAESRRGTTVFLNSHLLSEVERTCHRVAILDHGRIVREGSMEALTQTALRFRVRLADPPEQASLPVLEGVTVAVNNGHLEADVADIDALNRLVDALRTQGRLITELVPLRSDLEDIFVATVGQPDAGPRPAVVPREGKR